MAPPDRSGGHEGRRNLSPLARTLEGDRAPVTKHPTSIPFPAAPPLGVFRNSVDTSAAARSGCQARRHAATIGNRPIGPLSARPARLPGRGPLRSPFQPPGRDWHRNCPHLLLVLRPSIPSHAPTPPHPLPRVSGWRVRERTLSPAADRCSCSPQIVGSSFPRSKAPRQNDFGWSKHKAPSRFEIFALERIESSGIRLRFPSIGGGANLLFFFPAPDLVLTAVQTAKNKR